MNHRTVMFGLVVLLALMFSNCTRQSDFPILRGPYLGQDLPGMVPEVFAPGVISTGFHEHSFPSFSPDGKEVFWTQMMRSNYKFEFPVAIITMRMENGRWSEPDYADFSLRPDSGEAFVSPDGNRIYFSSTHSADSTKTGTGKFDIWYVEKTGNGWSDPLAAGPVINTTNHEFQPTVTRDHTLYFVGHWEGGKNDYGIYRSRFANGRFTEIELLPGQINTEHVEWTPFIAPDESYLLFSSLRPGGYGSGDLYICFRLEDGAWSEAINLGPTINKDDNERYPYVSPDGKYLFYVTDKVNDRLLEAKELSYLDYVDLYQKPGNGWSDIYWVDAKIIDDLKPDAIQ